MPAGMPEPHVLSTVPDRDTTRVTPEGAAATAAHAGAASPITEVSTPPIETRPSAAVRRPRRRGDEADRRGRRMRSWGGFLWWAGVSVRRVPGPERTGPAITEPGGALGVSSPRSQRGRGTVPGGGTAGSADRSCGVSMEGCSGVVGVVGRGWRSRPAGSSLGSTTRSALHDAASGWPAGRCPWRRRCGRLLQGQRALARVQAVALAPRRRRCRSPMAASRAAASAPAATTGLAMGALGSNGRITRGAVKLSEAPLPSSR